MTEELPKPNVKRKPNLYERFAQRVTRLTGSTAAFSFACLIILSWIVTGPIFHFSDTWQLVINTGTTIVTFLMVFLIQRSTNKESLALQLKLNELIAAVKGASNRLIDVESLTEEDLQMLHMFYRRLADMSAEEHNIRKSHSIEEASYVHGRKYKPEPEQQAPEGGHNPSLI